MSNLFFLVGLIALITATPLVLFGIYQTSKKKESITQNMKKEIDDLGGSFDEEIDRLKEDIENFEI